VVIDQAAVDRAEQLRGDGLSQRAAATKLRAEGFAIGRTSVQRIFSGRRAARPPKDPGQYDLQRVRKCPTCHCMFRPVQGITHECYACYIRRYAEANWQPPPVAEDV